MTYTLDTVPEDKEVWCAGFRFDDTKAGINCKPVQGTIHDKNYWKSKFKTKNRSISVNMNQSYYAFADTYEEAAHIYNYMVSTFLADLNDRFYRIAKSLEDCYIENKNGVVY